MSEKTTAFEGERIAKVMARAGVCSRREAERLVAAGEVSVNGSVIDSPALNVTEKDKITVKGKPLPMKEPVRLWRYHKPDGLVTSHKDPEGRPTVFDNLPPELPRVISVGRLDLTSEGLLLLTNDGETARKLELPSNGWKRTYRVRAHGVMDEKKLESLAQGITVDGVRYGAISAKLDNQTGANAWLTVTLTEGKNREIRKVFDHLGWPVSRLIRTSYGPFHLGKLAKGAVEEASPRQLKEQVEGEKTAKKGWAKAGPKKKPKGPPRARPNKG